MDRFIGLDAHASSCTLGVVGPGGKRVGWQVVEANARCLIEAVRQIPEPRHICLEEGTLSGWLHEVLSPHAERVVVTAVRESRGPKDDRRDAFGLADALRLGAIERAVYKKRGGFGALGYRARGYRWIRDDAVRVKNRLKSVYRSRGVAVPGTYLNRLPRPARPLAELLCRELDALEEQKREGVDLDPFSPERAPDADLISELGISPSRPMILTIGHVKATKATDVLVQAVPFTKAKVPDVQVVVAGSETPFIEEVKRLAVENGVKENLVFLGEVEHETVPALLARADVFVLPSRSEGLPIALLEAGAARLPVVATRVGGIPEVVDHGVNGYLVEPDDPPALGEHLAKLLLDPALRGQFGERLFTVVQGRLSWENTYQGYLAAHDAGRARNASLRG